MLKTRCYTPLFPLIDEGFVSATLESSQITDEKVTLNFVDDNGQVRRPNQPCLAPSNALTAGVLLLSDCHAHKKTAFASMI